MSPTINIKGDAQPRSCTRCHAIYATGIFNTPKGLVQLCATCALSTPCKQVVMFNYPDEHPVVSPPPIPLPDHLPRSIAPLAAIAIRRTVAHDPHFATMTDDMHKGNTRGYWAKRVACSECHIVYTAVREKACPACGTLNQPED